MVAEQPCEMDSQCEHPGSVALDNGQRLGEPPPDDQVYDSLAERSDMDQYTLSNNSSEEVDQYPYTQGGPVSGPLRVSELAFTPIPCLTGPVGTLNCDTNGNFSPLTEEPVDNYSFQSKDAQADSISTCSDSYSNSDYTDTVSSADSSKFLLPPKGNDADDMSYYEHSESNLVEGGEHSEAQISGSDCVINVTDCYENKDYTDSVASKTSSTQPLLDRTESIWSFIKEVEVSGPVIGLIDHPGFLSSQRDLSSTTNLSFACQKALKFLNDERVASSLLLPGSFKDISKQPVEDGKDGDLDHNIIPSGRHTRNLISLSICITMVFIACGSVRNLQSSINHEGGVGIVSLGVSCAGYIIGSIFSPFCVQNFHPYKCLIVSLFPHLLYVAANFYPVMYLMIPASILQGVSTAVLWNAMSTYITFLAKGYSEKRKQNYESVLSRFFSTFCLLWQLHMIFGNLISSLVLTYANPSTMSNTSLVTLPNETITPVNNSDAMYSFADSVIVNASSVSDFNISTSPHYNLCGANFCHHYTIQNDGVKVSDFAKYLLFGIYIGCMFIALIIALTLLEPLNKRLFSSTVMTCGMVKSQVVSLGRFMISRKFLLLCPLLLFSSMQAGFATAEITMAFVTCPVGVHMVGYTMICFGVSASASSYLSGWLSRCLGRTALFSLVP